MRVPVWFWLGFCISLCTPAGVGAQTPVGVEAIQWGLPSAGYDPGAADGLFGPRTRAAIRSWQSSRGARSTGHLDGPQVEASPRHGASSSPALAGATAAQAGGAQEPPVVPEERRLICLFKAGWPITLRYTREPAMPVMCFGTLTAAMIRTTRSLVRRIPLSPMVPIPVQEHERVRMKITGSKSS